MKFVKTDELKEGMRLAKPIYNKNGILLYDRNTKLTLPGINSISNFGLIGIYILEPAEPLPPLSREDIEFEQSQTIYMFQLRECFTQISKRQKMDKFDALIDDISKRYGCLDHRANFNQNLRSADDFVYKQAISVAILCAMISNTMLLSDSDQKTLICAAILYGFGYQFVPPAIIEKGDDLEQGDMDTIQMALEKGINYLDMYKDDYPFMKSGYSLIQYHIFLNNKKKSKPASSERELLLEDILKVAIKFDSLTSMKMNREPESEIQAMRFMMNHQSEYSGKVSSALAKSIHIVPAGASVDLSTNDKGIVLVENPDDFMRPLVLRLSDNQVYDLSIPTIYNKIKIVDLMKTMDNRVEIDEETLKHFVADERIKKTAEKFRQVLYKK